MLIGTNGIVINELAQVLLIRRNDTRTMAPPGGSAESGELPPDSLAREVREETGLIVMPVRLVGLYFLPIKPSGNLAFVFRCIPRGGEIAPTEEAPVVGYYPTHQLPGPMLPFHRERLEHAARHQGGPPVWVNQPLSWPMRLGKFLLDNLVYRYLDLRRVWRKQAAFQAATQWRCSAYLVLVNEAREVFWQRQAGGWSLPGAQCKSFEPPWETAARIAADLNLRLELTNLSGVYIQHRADHLHFVFTARLNRGGVLPDQSGAYFGNNREPNGAALWLQEWVTDALGPSEETIFRRQQNAAGPGDKHHQELMPGDTG